MSELKTPLRLQVMRQTELGFLIEVTVIQDSGGTIVGAAEQLEIIRRVNVFDELVMLLQDVARIINDEQVSGGYFPTWLDRLDEVLEAKLVSNRQLGLTDENNYD